MLSRRRIGITEIIQDLAHKFKSSRNNPKAQFEVPTFSKPIAISYNTINQREALKPLIEYLDDKADIISENSDFIPNQPDIAYYDKLSLKYSLHLIWWYYTFKGFQKEVFISRYYNFHIQLGKYAHLLKAFRKSPKLKFYLASNDHSGMSQIGFVAASTAGIKTIYIQHASVSDKFPPLQVDYALLEGEDAKAKYLAAGTTNAKIGLIGTMKYDSYLQSTEIETPGKYAAVCLGIASVDYDQNFELCLELKKSNMPFCLRFHPGVKENIRNRFIREGWNVSQPEQETALDFIMRCHTIISGDSNILLEAIILKRRPVYFASDGEGLDYYGFLKAGIIDTTHYRFEHVVDALQADFDIEQHRKNAKFYCDTLYTPFEGKSTELAIQKMNDILKG